MPNTFKSVLVQSAATASTVIYTCPVGTQTVALGLSASNTTASPTTVSFTIGRGSPTATNYFLIKNGNVPVGSALVVIGADQKIVLQAGDTLSVIAGSSSSIDVVFSLLEIN